MLLWGLLLSRSPPFTFHLNNNTTLGFSANSTFHKAISILSIITSLIFHFLCPIPLPPPPPQAWTVVCPRPSPVK
jgi:hypothetical protein